MTGYVLSRVAQTDLRQIWDYTRDRWSVDRAESYLRDIEHAVARAAADPRIGHSIDDVRAGYFRLSVGSHVLIYRVTADDVVDIVRALHRRMDLHRHL